MTQRMSGTFLLSWVVLTAAAVEAASEPAAHVLQATGVKGGLVIHVGCGNGKLTAALSANDSYVVHGLDADAKNIDAARKHIRAIGLYGKVSVEQWTGKRLPYADNLANLVVSQNLGGVPMAEVLRVLAPNGVAYVESAGQWTKIVKPRGRDIDEWTHFLHDAGNNAVARDTVVGPPRSLQWMAPPLWLRSHETPSGVQALVCGGGRVFYFLDEGLIGITDQRLPERWALVCRDAFNGKLLWRRPVEPLGLAVVALAARAEDNQPPAGFTAVFNGKDLSGWNRDSADHWKADGGMLVFDGKGGDLASKQSFGDFILLIDWKLAEGGNSGVFLRGGPQVEIWDPARWWKFGSGGIYPEQHKPLKDADKPIGQWNHFEIKVVKNAVTVRLNGELVLDSYECKFGAPTGPLRLQAHGTPLWFKNIYVKELPPDKAAPAPGSADKPTDKPVASKGKKVVFLAGGASHGRGEHAWPDGARLLKHCLDTSANVKGVTCEVYLNGWPTDPTDLDDAATIVLLSDGDGGHPLFKDKAREEKINSLMARGVGLVCIHYAVDPPNQGEEPLLRWIGGIYKTGYSTNPTNDVELSPATPDHPIARGLKPFKMRDEIYYRIWFGKGEGTGSATPIATITLAPEPKPQIVAWATERKDGGRGFGFTGCHVHKLWGIEGFRLLVLNAIVWTAKIEVPKEGVQSTVPSEMLEESRKE